ncbi:hypothetical protein H0H93_005723, partial [Arthromyces matolae]
MSARQVMQPMGSPAPMGMGAAPPRRPKGALKTSSPSSTRAEEPRTPFGLGERM